MPLLPKKIRRRKNKKRPVKRKKKPLKKNDSFVSYLTLTKFKLTNVSSNFNYNFYSMQNTITINVDFGGGLDYVFDGKT